MRLKKLKVVGFKSFADPVKLEFHAGITAIVGPNGCGKSNIADAFRWVLGEQSAKSLRGGRMQDVLFAGTSHRKPLNYAEVTLTLAGVEGALSLDYEEVAVSRKLHRSGESDYSINNQNVRLKDVQDLFLDSGIGKDAFAIFEQGKIDQIIQYGPLERRYIFEEAAGILRFLQRKREAFRRLEQTDLNTSRLKDIHLEVEKQIILLEAQAEKAQEYKQNRVHLEEMEKTVIVAKWEQTSKRKSEIFKKGDALNLQVESFLEKQQEHEKKLQEARNLLVAGENTLRLKSEEMYKTRSEKAIKSKEKQSQQERLKEAEEKEKRWLQELDAVLEKRKIRKIEGKEIQQQQHEVESGLLKLEEGLKEQREKTASVDNALSKLREQQQQLQQQLVSSLQKENRLESDLKQNTVRLESDNERKLRILQRKEILAKQIFELSQQIKEKRLSSQTSSAEIDQQKQRLTILGQEHDSLTKQIQSEQNSLASLQQDIQEAKARQKALERMRADLEGFSSGSKKLLLETQNAKSPFYKKIKPLHEYVTVKKGAETLFASALKPYAQTLVVENEADLEAVLTFSQKNKLKEFSLLCLTQASGQRKGKTIDVEALTPFMDFVEPNQMATHLLHDVFIAKDREGVNGLPKSFNGSLVTEDGYYIDGKHVLFQPNQTESNVFMREAELKSLGEKLSEWETLKAERELRLQEELKKRQLIHQQQMEQDKAIRKAEMSLLEINFAVQRLQGDEGKTKQEIQVIENDLQTLNTQIQNLQELLKDRSQKHVEAKAEAVEFQKQAVVLQEQIQTLSAVNRQELQILKEREASAHKVTDENRKLLHSLHVVEVKNLESLDQEKRLKEELRLVQELQKQLRGKEGDVDKSLSEVEALLLKVTQANAEVEAEVLGYRKQIHTIENEVLQHQKQLKQKEQEWNQARIGMAQLEAALTSLELEMKGKYQAEVEKIRSEAHPLAGSIESLEKQMKVLKQSLDEINDINLASIEECQKSKVRYETLNDQMDDLNLSRQELIRVIAELDDQSRKIFKETFQKIRANFQKNFQILFSGGEADLQFTETDNVLEAGIDIIARPPGKQMRSIQLLSGGEKCLTALALLFAIFEVKPAPFCILDEIDAPLDDANVERFVQMVKHYIDKCQFIIITHNKRTMAIADVIFGVSMEEKGISKLLSMEFMNEAPSVSCT